MDTPRRAISNLERLSGEKTTKNKTDGPPMPLEYFMKDLPGYTSARRCCSQAAPKCRKQRPSAQKKEAARHPSHSHRNSAMGLKPRQKKSTHECSRSRGARCSRTRSAAVRQYKSNSRRTKDRTSLAGGDCKQRT